MPNKKSQHELTPETTLRMPLRLFIVMIVAVVTITASVVIFIVRSTPKSNEIAGLKTSLSAVQNDLKKIRDEIKELRSEKTSKFDVSPKTIGEDLSTFKRRAQFLSLGYDLHMFFGLALSSPDIEFSKDLQKALNGTRFLTLQEAKLLGVDIKLPDNFEGFSKDDVSTFMQQAHLEVTAKIEAENQSLIGPYRYGRWLALALVSVANARYSSTGQVKELLNLLIDKYDSELKDFKDFPIRDEIRKEFSEVRSELVALARIGNVENSDYSRLSQKVVNLVNKIRKQPH